MAFASRVRFDTPFGFTAATQLAFVPLLFAMPVALVPIAVLIALLAGAGARSVGGERLPRRALLTVGNSWFAIGPVAVFAVADVAPRHAGAALLLLALIAQFAVDFVVSTLRFAMTRAPASRAQLSRHVGLRDRRGAVGDRAGGRRRTSTRPRAALAPLPLLALLALFARERHRRLQSLLELNNAYRGTALVLGDVVEADDGYTGEHSKSVVGLALAVGEAARTRRPSSAATSSSQPCCTTWARSRSPRRSSTSPASSTRTSGS